MTAAIHPSSEALLRRIVMAGELGLSVSPDCIGDLIALQIEGLALYVPQVGVAVSTEKGRAFSLRSAA